MTENPIDAAGTDVDPAAHPQVFYRAMREDAPVVTMERNLMETTLVFRHDDIMAVLHDPALFSSNDDAIAIGQVRPLIPLQIDPPRHRTFRRLLDPLFAPKRVAALEATTRALVNEMIDAVVDEGRANFHRDIAEPLPTTVFLGLLGLPVSRRDEFIALKDGIIRPDADTAEERAEAVAETGQAIYAVLDEVIAERQAERRDDFISGFLDAEVDGERLTPEEVADIGYLFFLAGLDTVTASLDCMLAYLAASPSQRRRLAEEPDVIPRAIEELLRWETPVPGVIRIATADTELRGCPVPKGSTVSVILGSANVDAAEWDEPERVDFDREVNKHLAFGGGVHRCLGSHLARMELRVVLEEWHRRVPDYRIADDITLEYTPNLRQVENLELVW